MRINVLSKDIADKIAAGEVIENPLSVIKELVENSIDASSSFITVEIKDGGKSFIRVSDNGIGIDKDDIEKAFLPHATSKISDESDLNSISSLGFRGEALTSIAAVSNTELITRTKNDKTGTSFNIKEGIALSKDECAAEIGTTIIVKDLFFNLPARKKFLKSDTRESSEINDFVSRVSLAYPNIKFRMINNGTILFTTPGKGDIYQTILTVFSPQSANKLIHLDYKRDGLRLYGYISSPLESRNNRKQQIFFVNGRLISSKVFDQALSLAYQDKLFAGKYPIAYLFLELDPSKTDVNVHPRKTEIKFFDDEVVREFIIQAVRKALLNPDATKIDIHEVKIPAINFNVQNKINEIKYDIPNISFKNDIFKELRNDSIKEDRKSEIQEDLIVYNAKDELKFSLLMPINQIFSTYILAVDNNGLYIIDQHAAHERVMYEKILNSFNQSEKNSQSLITPIVVDLGKSEMLTANESIPVLNNMGFVLEEFGSNSFIIKAIPYFMTISESDTFVKEFFQTSDELKSNIQLRKDFIISKACKSAVKANDKLSNAEIKALFEELDNCENPFSCPHGRPTFIKLSANDLERMFKRK